MFLVIEKVSGCWIGWFGFWCFEGWFGIEVGWGLLCEVWGRGYVIEGLVVVIDWVFEYLGWSEVIYIIVLDNFVL